ncbi:hypothetical protein SLE2022_081060 [Rubroshorea leprosula]
MILTKSHKVASKLVKAFTNHWVCKSYVAPCNGAAPKWEKKKSLWSQVMVNQVMELGVTDAKKDEILVRAFPRNARTHQIRLLCQYLRISIIRDVKYERLYEWKGRTYNALDHHAESLSFEHHITGFQS